MKATSSDARDSRRLSGQAPVRTESPLIEAASGQCRWHGWPVGIGRDSRAVLARCCLSRGISSKDQPCGGVGGQPCTQRGQAPRLRMVSWTHCVAAARGLRCARGHIHARARFRLAARFARHRPAGFENRRRERVAAIRGPLSIRRFINDTPIIFSLFWQLRSQAGHGIHRQPQ